MAKLPENVSASTRRLNPHLYGPVAAGEAARLPAAGERPVGKPLVEVSAAEDRKRIRQDPKPLLNELEAEFLAELTRYHPHAVVWKQALRWRLGNGIWYKPDFVAFVRKFAPAGAPVAVTRLTCWEVKGPHAFRGGFENLKVAAGLYPEVRWLLVWKDQGRWREQEVLP